MFNPLCFKIRPFVLGSGVVAKDLFADLLLLLLLFFFCTSPRFLIGKKNRARKKSRQITKVCKS